MTSPFEIAINCTAKQSVDAQSTAVTTTNGSGKPRGNFQHSRDMHNMIFRKLLLVVPDLLNIPEHGKSVINGFMDLNLDVIERTTSKLVIALSHYYRHPSGDMIADPDMEIAVYLELDAAEALTYQDTFSYQVVYQGGIADVRAKKELNAFLHQWLRNLIEQGHRIAADSTEVAIKECENG